MIDRKLPAYHGPFSTTTSLYVADRISKGRGLRFTILI